MIGKILGGRYEILEIVGTGGMAYVYKAKDKLLNRLVAIKILKNEFNQNEQFIQKFKRESQAAASLSHNNIVKVFDVGVQENNHYIVMEYVSGQTLKEYIRDKGKLPWREALFITKQIAFALDHAHKNKIIHRDIKPHNIILNEEMIPKVTDFGIARAISSATITLVEETMGSVHYISPEQARGGFVDEKSDLYSLGIVLYEMITGKVPFDSDNSVSIAIKHIQEDIVIPQELEDIPQGLIDIALKLVKKSPVERYKNARDLIMDLILVQNNPDARINIIEESVDSATKKTPIIEELQLKKINLKENHKKKPFSKKTIAFIVLASIVLGVVVFALVNGFKVKEVEVPDFYDMSIDKAIELLESKKLDYSIERANHSEVETDHIIKQDPVAKSIVKEGHKITITVSDGPKEVEVPDVTKMFEVEGVQKLENDGFVVTETLREYNEQYESGVIYDQSPAAGSMLQIGSEIKLYVSKGKNVVLITDYTGKNINDVKNQLLSAGLIASIEEVYSETHEKDIVIGQNPTVGSEVAKNSVVNITVSKGLIKSKPVKIDLSSFVKVEEGEDPKKVSVKVFLFNQENVSSVVYTGDHFSNDIITVNMKGIGVQYYQVQVNDKMSDSIVISF